MVIMGVVVIIVIMSVIMAVVVVMVMGVIVPVIVLIIVIMSMAVIIVAVTVSIVMTVAVIIVAVTVVIIMAVVMTMGFTHQWVRYGGFKHGDLGGIVTGRADEPQYARGKVKAVKQDQIRFFDCLSIGWGRLINVGILIWLHQTD